MDVQLLGPLRVVDGSHAVRVTGETQRALLAFLALRVPHVAPGDLISEALWPDSPSDNALHVAVSRLRKILGSEHIETTPGGYRLASPLLNIDVERFRRSVKRGRQLLTLGQPAKAAEAIRPGMAQWQGDALLDVCQFEFAERAARLLKEERMDRRDETMDRI